MNTLLAKKDQELERLNDMWQSDLEALEASRLEVVRLEDSVRREADSKKRIEAMLKSYKDEVRERIKLSISKNIRRESPNFADIMRCLFRLKR